jgi:hypothetical protein
MIASKMTLKPAERTWQIHAELEEKVQTKREYNRNNSLNKRLSINDRKTAQLTENPGLSLMACARVLLNSLF